MSSVALSLLGRIEEEMTSKFRNTATREEAPQADPLADVVAGCRRREADAQRELVLQTQDRVYRTLFRLVGAQDAEDVAQQVYLQIFRQVDRFRGKSSFNTWLYRVTVNEALQHLRRKRRRRFAILNWDPQEHATDHCRQSEVRELLDRALAEIDPELRSIFVLREVEELSYEEIGPALQIPPGTVASRLSRARHQLQERLRRLGWEPVTNHELRRRYSAPVCVP
jgi:RNA polymerase sigma-70 factor, ECF subfamily